MIESTARVERSQAESPSRPGYVWEVPQKPVSVYLPFEMIDRLENLVVENFRSLTSRGSEIGGLLIGRSGQANPLVVLVENFELISCDYSRGPLYRLSESDMARFERVIEQYSSGPGPRVVGYFRSHTRKGLALDPDDLTFLDARFREPQHISLLVRPFASKPSTGAIFVRENGGIRAESSYLEFPFRSSQLTATANPPRIESAAAEPIASAAPAPAQKPPVRGQIVPIASRREISVPPPEPAPVQAPVAASVAETAQPAPVQPAPAPKPAAEPAMRAPEKRVEKPVERPAEKKIEKKAEKIEKPEETPAPRRGEAAVPKAFAEAEASSAAPAAGGGGKLVWLVAALALAAVLGGGYLFYPGFHKAARVPTGSSDTTDLGLRVEHSGADLVLTWNRDSYGAKNGKQGVLQVFDGDSKQNYPIDHDSLTSGLGVVYTPQTQDVSFAMTVTDEKGVEIGKGGQRVLHPRPSPMDDPKAASASNTTKPTPAAPTTPAAKPETPAAETAAAAEPAPAPEKVTRKFNEASLGSGRLRQAAPSDLANALPDAPTVGGAAPQAAQLPGGLAGIAPPPPNKQTAPPPPAARSGASQISQAVLVYKKDPEYPKMAQQMGQRGIVELDATIGIDGRVKGVKVVKGPPMLQKPAQEAVMQWIYKPTVLNGTPVENQTHISIEFQPPNKR